MATETRIEDADAARRRRRRDQLSSLGLAVAGCLVGLLLAEVGLRLMGFSYVRLGCSDPVLGWVGCPGTKGRYTQEGNAAVEINRYGFRDREWEVEKPAGRYRVAVLGDSFTAAHHVDAEQRFTSVLEGQLRDCDALKGRRPEVLNFGIAGWGTAQELLCLRNRVWQFDPDSVVLAFFAGNDLQDNSQELDIERKPRPYFKLHDRTLVLDDSFRDQPSFRREATWSMQVVRSAALFLRAAQVLARGMDALKQTSQPLIEEGRARSEDGRARSPGMVMEPGLAANVYFEPDTPAWEEAWRVTEALLIETEAEARRHGSPFTLMLVTIPNQVQPGAAAKAQAFGLEDLLYPNRRLVELGRRQGFPVLSLAEPFLARAESDGSQFHGFSTRATGHWNALGHRAAGELLAAELCGKLKGREGGSPSS